MAMRTLSPMETACCPWSGSIGVGVRSAVEAFCDCNPRPCVLVTLVELLSFPSGSIPMATTELPAGSTRRKYTAFLPLPPQEPCVGRPGEGRAKQADDSSPPVKSEMVKPFIVGGDQAIDGWIRRRCSSCIRVVQ